MDKMMISRVYKRKVYRRKRNYYGCLAKDKVFKALRPHYSMANIYEHWISKIEKRHIQNL